MPKGCRTCHECGESKSLWRFALQGLGRRDRTCKECRNWQAAEARSKRYAITEAYEQLQRRED